MRTRPRTKYVRKLKNRRCPRCGAKLHPARKRCKRCAALTPKPKKSIKKHY